MASKYYAVKKGKVPGIYLNWNDCKAMVDGYQGAVYKSFKTIEEAEKLNNLINDCGAYGRIKPSNLLREFISYFEQRMFKTETVSDFKNGVQLIKKR